MGVMISLILIVQTFTGAMAYEYGPYPDVATCEKFAVKHISEIESSGGVLKVATDCKHLHPELQELAKADEPL